MLKSCSTELRLYILSSEKKKGFSPLISFWLFSFVYGFNRGGGFNHREFLVFPFWHNSLFADHHRIYNIVSDITNTKFFYFPNPMSITSNIHIVKMIWFEIT